MSRTLSSHLAALAALAILIGVGLAGGRTAQAFPDAQIDAQIRPPFGALIDPPMRRWHPYRPIYRGSRWIYEREGRDYPLGPEYGDGRGYDHWRDPHWRGDHGYPIQGPIQTITIDCGDASLGPTPLSDALRALADGGTLYIKAGGHPCVESLFISRPVTIAGESAPAFVQGPAPGPAIVTPPAGAPCVQVMPGAGVVELRDLAFSALQSHGQACIQSWDSALAIVRSRVDYVGDASAVFVAGGRLLIRASDISSGSYDPAVATEGASVMLDDIGVVAAATGLDITPNASSDPIALTNISVTSAPGTDANLAPETGIVLRYARGGSAAALVMQGGQVSGFRAGVWLDQGARANLSQVRIVQSRIGIISRAMELSLTESELDVDRTGVNVVMGHAKILHNTIAGFDGPPILIESDASVTADDNWIYPRRGCGSYREFRHSCGEMRDRDRDHSHDRGHGPPVIGQPSPTGY